MPLSRIGPLASELSGDTCGADGHERVGAVVVQSGKWLYHAMYMIPLEADEADASDAIHFVRSFKLLPR